MPGLLAAVAATLTLTVLGVSLGTRASEAQSASSKLVAGVLPGLKQATLVSPAPAGQSLQIGVALADPHPAAEQAYYQQLSQPGSPDYHHFLTPAQFNSRFGVSPASAAAVRSWLTGGGLRITSTSAADDYFTATGTVSQLDRLLSVSIGDYQFKGVRFFANDQAPSVPASLPVDSVIGLDSLGRFKPDALTPKATGTQLEFTPQQLWSIYDDPGAAALTKSDGTSDPATVAASPVALGQGQKIGIFGEGETSSIVAQLRLFEAHAGLPRVPVRTVETEGGPDSAYGDNSGADEWDLDSQSSTGMAPDVSQLDFYFGKSLGDADVAKMFDSWAADPNGPRQMNASFGECEENPTNPVTGSPVFQSMPFGTGLGDNLEAAAEPILEKAAIEGRTLFAAAGDTASGCDEVVAPIVGAGNGLVPQPVPLVSYPCASQYVVCVGGTVVSAAGGSGAQASQRASETNWTFTGGGSSDFIPEPSFQKGVTAIHQDCVSQPDGTPYSSATVCRGVPDVAALSGDEAGDGYTVYIDGATVGTGGTSLSSPLTMGQWARIQSAASAKVQSAGGLGFADPVIYKQAAGADGCTTAPCSDPTYERDFFDVTASEDVGDEGGIAGVTVPTGVGAGNGAYQPGPGWDYTSGWGSLNVANFMQDVDGTTSAAGSYTGAESAPAKMCTFTGTSPTGNATDSVTMQNDTSADLTKATLSAPSAGTITATITAPSLGSGLPSGATAASFFVAWSYGGKVYYARAAESPSGFTYTSGTAGSLESGGYTDTASSKATGSVDDSTGTITIHVPATEVGSPGTGALLEDPQAFVDVTNAAGQVFVATATDSADNLVPYSQDGGAADSRGVDVVVGGVPGSTCDTKLPPVISSSKSSSSAKSGSGAVACVKAKLPVTHITRKSFNRRGVKLAGTAAAHCPDHITKVAVSLARMHGRKCSFLTAKHRWTKAGGCRPRDYLRAKGTAKWSFSLRVKLRKGVYHLWERATDNRKLTSRNTAAKHVWVRVR